MTGETRSPRLAVLIDADNASSKIVDGLFDEMQRLAKPASVVYMAIFKFENKSPRRASARRVADLHILRIFSPMRLPMSRQPIVTPSRFTPRYSSTDCPPYS